MRDFFRKLVIFTFRQVGRKCRLTGDMERGLGGLGSFLIGLVPPSICGENFAVPTGRERGPVAYFAMIFFAGIFGWCWDGKFGALWATLVNDTSSRPGLWVTLEITDCLHWSVVPLATAAAV